MRHICFAAMALVSVVCLFPSSAGAQLIQTAMGGLNDPFGVAVDNQGNVYVADTYNEYIRVLNTQTTAITIANVTIQPGQVGIVAGNGTAGYSGDGGAATNAEIYNPIGLAVDNSGNIYIADLYNYRVRKVNNAGIISTVTGLGTQVYGGDNGPASAATLYPYAVAVDGQGILYISDTYNQRIRVVNTSGSTITRAGVKIPPGYIATVAGNGNIGTAGNGPALNAEFSDPYGMAVDTNGNIYICDTYNRQIYAVNVGTTTITVAGIQIQPGYIAIVAGNGNYGYRGDGFLATTAEFSDPDGVAVDSAGNIYVSDTENERVRKITNSTGLISTVAGNGTYGYNGDGIPATSAMLTYPREVAVDGGGNVYFADEPNLRVREVQVNPGMPAITSRASTAFTAGVQGTFTVTTADLPTPALSETGSLPMGVTFVDNGNGTGTLSGTPISTTAGSTFPITFGAKNSIGMASQAFSLVIYGPGGGPTATFVGQDNNTEGAWEGKYGADGYVLANVTQQKIPAYAIFSVQNQINYTWDSAPTSPRALEVPGSGTGIAAAWYSNSSFYFDVNFIDGQTHLFALYAVDWDYNGRTETLQVQDANTGIPLDTETISNFTSGVYLVWRLSGHVQIIVTPSGVGNAVVSGAFFGGAGNSSTPTLIITKTHTGNFGQGQQNATYSITVQDAAYGTPTSGTVTVTDTVPPGLTLLSMTGSGWACVGNSCSRGDSLAAGATYSPITVTVNVAAGAPSPQVNQASVSGGGSAPASATDTTLITGTGVAAFVGTDITTEGNWLQKYGSNGYALANVGQSLPPYDSTFTTQQIPAWTWAASTTDPRALETDSKGDRAAAGWYTTGSTIGFDMSITDSQTHQIAVYAVDWDNKGRTETIQIVDGGSGAVLDSRTIPGANTSTTSTNFVNGTYLIWNVSGHVGVVVTSNGGPNGVLSGIFWGGSAVSITATSGTPQSAPTNTAFSPLVATVTTGGSPLSGVNVTFTAPSTGVSGTFAGGSNTATVQTNAQGVATAPTFTANATVGGPYTVTTTVSGAATPAVFSLSNLVQVGPPATVVATGGTPQSAQTSAAFAAQLQATVYDALNNPVSNVSVLFTAPASGASGTFAGGSNTANATTNAQGVATSPVFTANATAGGPYAVVASVSGATSANFLLTNTAPQTGPCTTDCATFVGTDTTTEGAWEAKYGIDGYSLANSAQSLPSYATTFTVNNQSSYTWAANTTDPRALEVPGGTGGIAAAWYKGTSFYFDVNVGTGTHQVALYALDWDNGGRSEMVQVFDANSNSTTPLNTETVSSFGTGVYLIWNITGHVHIVVTETAGPNAVISGMFFGGGPPAAVVSSFSKDTTTQGAWQSHYGSDGYSLANSGQSIPSYAAFAVQNQGNYTWIGSTTDPRALQVPGGTGGIAAAWYGATFDFDVNVGTSSHQVALYVLDWDNAGRAEMIQIFDANSGSATPLDTENVSSFTSGVYLVWNITGHVKIVITQMGATNAVVSGVFFGGAPTSATVTSFSEDTSTEGAWQGKYGTSGYSLANSVQSTLAYATFASQNAGTYTWTPSTSDPRALQLPGGATGIASAWYNGTFNLDVNVGTGSHSVALYVLDWDSKGRAETIQVFDANSNSSTPLDTRTISGFSGGVYLIWTLNGHVRFTVTATSGPNAVVSGIFFQ